MTTDLKKLHREPLNRFIKNTENYIKENADTLYLSIPNTKGPGNYRRHIANLRANEDITESANELIQGIRDHQGDETTTFQINDHLTVEVIDNIRATVSYQDTKNDIELIAEENNYIFVPEFSIKIVTSFMTTLIKGHDVLAMISDLDPKSHYMINSRAIELITYMQEMDTNEVFRSPSVKSAHGVFNTLNEYSVAVSTITLSDYVVIYANKDYIAQVDGTRAYTKYNNGVPKKIIDHDPRVEVDYYTTDNKLRYALTLKNDTTWLSLPTEDGLTHITYQPTIEFGTIFSFEKIAPITKKRK